MCVELRYSLRVYASGRPVQAIQILRSIRSHRLRSRALSKAKRTPDADPSAGLIAPPTEGLMPLARTKLKAMAKVLGCTEAEASLRIMERTLASLPDRALPAYLLPSLAIKRAERIGEELVRMDLADGRTFTGHRSNQKEFFLYQMLSQHLPAEVDGDAYKLALDIERRYYAYLFRGSSSVAEFTSKVAVSRA